MTTPHLGDSYEFESKNRAECYGADINFYIHWQEHLMCACPSAYRAPVDMTLRDFMEQFFKPDYAAHPDTAKLDLDKLEWKRDQEAWQPDLDKSLKDNGVGHMDYLEIRSPGLAGMHGKGY